MKQAAEKCEAKKRSARVSSRFVPAVRQRWQYGSGKANSILVNVKQVVDGLLKIEGRHPEWKTSLAVSQILLMRLEAMREEIRRRSGMLASALALEDYDRAKLEADAINQLVCTFDVQEKPGRAIHGIRVTTDRVLYGLEAAHS